MATFRARDRSTAVLRSPRSEVWAALTEPAFTRRYWGAVLESDWQVGSPVLWGEGEAPADTGQVVLESDPPRRLAYSWHAPSQRHAELLGWSAERLAELQAEPRSRVSFEIAAVPAGVRLRVVHDGFGGATEMADAVSGRLAQTGGWPQVLAGLKSLLETGEPLGAW